MIENIRKYTGLMIVVLVLLFIGLVFLENSVTNAFSGQASMVIDGEKISVNDYNRKGLNPLNIAEQMEFSPLSESARKLAAKYVGDKAANSQFFQSRGQILNYLTLSLGNSPDRFLANRIAVQQAGLKYGVTPGVEEVELFIREAVFADAEGKFDQKAYSEFLSKRLGRLGLDSRSFNEYIRDLLTAQNLSSLIGGPLKPDPQALRQTQLINSQSITGSEITLVSSKLENDQNPTEEEIKAYWEENQDKYNSDEKRSISYVMIEPDWDAKLKEVEEKKAKAEEERKKAEAERKAKEEEERKKAEEAAKKANEAAAAAKAEEEAKKAEETPAPESNEENTQPESSESTETQEEGAQGEPGEEGEPALAGEIAKAVAEVEAAAEAKKDEVVEAAKEVVEASEDKAAVAITEIKDAIEVKKEEMTAAVTEVKEVAKTAATETAEAVVKEVETAVPAVAFPAEAASPAITITPAQPVQATPAVEAEPAPEKPAAPVVEKTAKEQLNGVQKTEAVKALIEEANKIWEAALADATAKKDPLVALEKKGQKVIRLEPFTKADPPKELDIFASDQGVGKLSDVVFKMPANGVNDERLSEPYRTNDGFFIGVLGDVIPSQPLSYEEAKVQATVDLKKKMAREALKKQAEEKREKLLAAVKEGKSFADAAKELELTVKPVNKLTIPSVPAQFRFRFTPPAFEAAKGTDPNTISEIHFTPSEEEPETAVIVYVEKREFKDDDAFATALDDHIDESTDRYRLMAFQAWLDQEYAKRDVQVIQN